MAESDPGSPASTREESAEVENNRRACHVAAVGFPGNANPCRVCGARFNGYRARRRHERLYHEEDPLDRVDPQTEEFEHEVRRRLRELAAMEKS